MFFACCYDNLFFVLGRSSYTLLNCALFLMRACAYMPDAREKPHTLSAEWRAATEDYRRYQNVSDSRRLSRVDTSIVRRVTRLVRDFSTGSN